MTAESACAPMAPPQPAGRIDFAIGGAPSMYAGHFPGHPVVPGAYLLDAVIARLRAAGVIPSGPVSIGSAKFVAMIGPGSTIRLDWQTTAGGACRFECSVDGRRVASGVAQTS